MKIKNTYPPNIEEIKKKFVLCKNVVFTYGDTIYNPDKAELTDDILIHEQIHIEQQSENTKEWWTKYLTDDKFRLEQELEAYREQYKYARSHYIRPRWKELLRTISKHLSGKIYGNLVSEEEAKKLICEQ